MEEELTVKLRYMETQLAEKDEKIKLLARKNSFMEKTISSQRSHQKIKEIEHNYEISLRESGKSSSANIVKVTLIYSSVIVFILMMPSCAATHHESPRP